MKIYAANYLNIERYAGQDLWIKVRIANFLSRHYIRVLEVVDDIVYYNMCNSEKLDLRRDMQEFDPFEILMGKQNYINDALTHQCHTPKEDIHILQPIDILTTDEIIAGLTENLEE